MLLDWGLLLLQQQQRSPKSSVIVSMDTFMYPLNECKCTHLVDALFSRKDLRSLESECFFAGCQAKLYIHTDTYSSTHADTKG